MNVVGYLNSFSSFFLKIFKTYNSFLTFNSGSESSLLKMFLKPKISKASCETFTVFNIIYITNF